MTNEVTIQTIETIESLLKDYYFYASKLLSYTDKYWDNMYIDIQGYSEALIYCDDMIDVNVLKNQVIAVKMLVEANERLNYIFG